MAISRVEASSALRP